jgi:hypothetical protein
MSKPHKHDGNLIYSAENEKACNLLKVQTAIILANHNYIQWADAMHARPVLLVEADDQNHADMEALASALRQKAAIAVEQTAVATDHSFSDHRIELQSIVIRWLETLNK